MSRSTFVLPSGTLFNGFRNKRALLITGDGSGRGIRNAHNALIDQRAVRIPPLVEDTVTGQVTLIVDGTGRITSARLETGSDRLRGAVGQLKGLSTGLAAPDGQSIQFVRQGNILCGPKIGCVMYLLRPVDVRPTFLPQ